MPIAATSSPSPLTIPSSGTVSRMGAIPRVGPRYFSWQTTPYPTKETKMMSEYKEQLLSDADVLEDIAREIGTWLDQVDDIAAMTEDLDDGGEYFRNLITDPLDDLRDNLNIIRNNAKWNRLKAEGKA